MDRAAIWQAVIRNRPLSASSSGDDQDSVRNSDEQGARHCRDPISSTTAALVPDSPVATAYHKAITEHRALARVPKRGPHVFATCQPERRQGTCATARSDRDS